MRISMITVLASAAALLAACDSGSAEPAAKSEPAAAQAEVLAGTTSTSNAAAPSAAATPANGEAGMTKFLDKAKVCSDTASEMGDNEEQNTQLMKIWADTGCPALEAETAASLQAYTGDMDATAKIKTAVEPLGY